jgi:stage III sporulation protein SpoIIIAA
MLSPEEQQASFADAAYSLLVNRSCTIPEKAMSLSLICESLYAMKPSKPRPSKPLECLRKHPHKFVVVEAKTTWHVWAISVPARPPATSSVAGLDQPPQPSTGDVDSSATPLDTQLIQILQLELARGGVDMGMCGNALYGPNVLQREGVKQHLKTAGGLHAWLSGFPHVFTVSQYVYGSGYTVSLAAQQAKSPPPVWTPVAAAAGASSRSLLHDSASRYSAPSASPVAIHTPPSSTPHQNASAHAAASVSGSTSRGFFDVPAVTHISASPQSAAAAGTHHTSQHSIQNFPKLAAALPAAAVESYRLPSGQLVELVQTIEHLKQLIAADAVLRGDARCVVAVDCEGVPESLHLMQLAYHTTALAKRVLILDGVRLGEDAMCTLLAPLLTSDVTVKLFHDVHMDAVALADIGGVQLTNCIDSQLVMELLHGSLHMGFNDTLQKLDHATHTSKSAIKKQMNAADGSIFSRRPLTRELVEYAALDVALLLSIKDSLLGALAPNELQDIQTASDIRAAYAVMSGGQRRVCADLSNDYSLASRELMEVFRPDCMEAIKPLVVSNEISALLSLLPADITSDLIGHEEGLSDIQLDKGRRPLAWSNGTRLFLGAEERTVSMDELEGIVKRLGGFGSDNRAGLEAQLHRISAIRNRADTIIGLTMRVGRHVGGNAAMIADILFRDDKSILFLGEPGSGKTTIVREATRLLAEMRNVLIVDTSNEIAGDGDVPHPCVGLARRLQVRHLADQCSVMIEGVQNHTPEVMVIDEIGRPEEVDAARTCKMRGVRMIASAHGDLRKLIKNKQLKGLVGGIEVVTLGDEAARQEAKRQGAAAGGMQKVKSQRAGQPIFDVIVELHRGELHEWRVVMNCADAVDRVLEGGDYLVQRRSRDPGTGELFLELQKA